MFSQFARWSSSESFRQTCRPLFQLNKGLQFFRQNNIWNNSLFWNSEAINIQTCQSIILKIYLPLQVTSKPENHINSPHLKRIMIFIHLPNLQLFRFPLEKSKSEGMCSFLIYRLLCGMSHDHQEDHPQLRLLFFFQGWAQGTPQGIVAPVFCHRKTAVTNHSYNGKSWKTSMMKHDESSEKHGNIWISVVSWRVIIMIDGAETYPINMSSNIMDCDYDTSIHVLHHFGRETPIEQSQLNSHLISCSWTNHDVYNYHLAGTNSISPEKSRRLALFLRPFISFFFPPPKRKIHISSTWLHFPIFLNPKQDLQWFWLCISLAKQLQQRHVPVLTRFFRGSRGIRQAAQHGSKALVTLQHRAEGLKHQLTTIDGFSRTVFGRCGFTLLKFGFRNTSLYSFIVLNYTESHLPTSKSVLQVSWGEVWSDIHRSSIRFVNFSLIVCTENVRISTYKIQLPNLLHSFGCHSDGRISSWGSTEAQLNRETSCETQWSQRWNAKTNGSALKHPKISSIQEFWEDPSTHTYIYIYDEAACQCTHIYTCLPCSSPVRYLMIAECLSSIVERFNHLYLF